MARLSAEERKHAILEAAIPLFADRGFAAVTTREIAQAAGISEALLYRHFPSKQNLYEEIQQHFVCFSGEPVERLRRLPDTTASLVVCVYALMWKVQCGPEADACRHLHLRRLLTRSLLEDGRFCAEFLDKTASLWVDKIQSCLHAAIEAGDVTVSWEEAEFGIWMGHHIAVAIGLYSLPEATIVDYPGGNDAIVQRSVRFALRGLGMTEAALQRHLNPEVLELLLSSGLANAAG